MKLPKTKKGFAGRLAEAFVLSKLTPVGVLVSLFLGVIAIVFTPKEEEPQITVPMIDIAIPALGLEASEVENKVVEPTERSLWGLSGVEYLYSVSSANQAMITVRFKVNENIEESLVKVHHKLMALKSRLPKNTLDPIVKSYTIDDVPFLAVSFTSNKRNDYELRTIAASLQKRLSVTTNVANVSILGGRKKSIRVIARPKKLKAHGVTLEDLYNGLIRNHVMMPVGKNWSDKKVYDVEVGGKLKGPDDIGSLTIAITGGRSVSVADVASIEVGAEQRTRLSYLYDQSKGISGEKAVTLSFSKRKGTNVVALTENLLNYLDSFKQELPDDVKVSVVRNYGQTAKEKSNELIEHLLIATISVSLLIALVMGFRAAIVVAIAIPVTLALTLAIYYFMGYTLNRVTLFALIFSIGILVDDAIVVVENIERYLHTYKKLNIVQATLRAVSEVGNPTVLATFTVIGAILPMAFVSGLMGPYMRPIPVGASVAMIFSLLIAFIVTPWASVKLLKRHNKDHAGSEEYKKGKEKFLDRVYTKFTGKLLDYKLWPILFHASVILLLGVAGYLVYGKYVKVKMLPFDNKSEFQVLIDYPPTTSLEQSTELSKSLANDLLAHPDVKLVQIFGGEPAPFSFSGMVKHTYLRNMDYMNDLHILLKDKHDREKSGHELINELRPLIFEFAKKHNALSKVLEIPPGPPVMATMVAEIYGKNRDEQRVATQKIKDIFMSEESFVDIDTTLRQSRPRQIIPYDFDKAKGLGTSAFQAWNLGRLIFSETSVGTIEDMETPEPVSIDLGLDNNIRSSENPFIDEIFPSFTAGVVRPKDVLGTPYIVKNRMLHRKNLRPVEYVFAELAGKEEAPVYGMLKIADKVPYKTMTAHEPWDTRETVVKWDGEWFITYEVFRDLGFAFCIVMILIYILVVGWFRSFVVPLVIMAPIPISLIGIIPGHAILGVYFTATSMIGFIAGAGVIVRNSIILVDFIEHQMANGQQLRDAVISAGILRFRPMLLTASAVVAGSAIMLFDPIFQGLAISMIFGEVAATFLSRFSVPVIYYWIIGKRRYVQITNEQKHIDLWGSEA